MYRNGNMHVFAFLKRLTRRPTLAIHELNTLKIKENKFAFVIFIQLHKRIVKSRSLFQFYNQHKNKLKNRSRKGLLN